MAMLRSSLLVVQSVNFRNKPSGRFKKSPNFFPLLVFKLTNIMSRIFFGLNTSSSCSLMVLTNSRAAGIKGLDSRRADFLFVTLRGETVSSSSSGDFSSFY